MGARLMKDNFGREISYLRVSLTDRCNLRCIYCMPEQGVEKKGHQDILRYEQVLEIIKAAVSLGINKIRFTGGEPLVLPGIDKLIYETSQLQENMDISLTTNGILLGDYIDDLKKAGLSRVNISLDTLNKEKYKHITRIGDIDKVLVAIKKCIEVGLSPVKINVVLIKGFNDDEISDFIKLTIKEPIEVRFIELMPIGEGIKLYENGRMSFEEVLEQHPELIPEEMQKGSTAQLYRVPGSKGKVGFISPVSCKFCEDCNKIRLTSTGTIKPCLHSEEEYDLKEYLKDETLLKEALRTAILNKPEEHHLNEEKQSNSKKMMYQIGG
jgi:GTP 3',8-cyclase